jgi:ATP-dependent helicase/DNAse subunit B
VIDRVETVDSKSGEMIVYDYKSGRPDGLPKRYFRAGNKLIDFGIPLYAVYLDEVEKARLAGAFYYMLLKSEGTPDKAGIVKRDSMGRLFPIQERRRAYFSILGEEQFAAELSRYRSEITAVADNISAGNFPVTPIEGECAHCEYSTVCRYGGQLK